MPAVLDTPFPLLKDYFKCLVEGFDDLSVIRREGRGMDLKDVKIPALYCTGWYDSSRNSVIDHCRVQRENGTDSEVLIAPWHGGEAPARADSALETGELAIDIQQEMLQWFDYWLKGTQKQATLPYRYYDVATGEFWNGTSWHDAENDYHTLYLRECGALSAHVPDDAEPVDCYIHDPDHPLPFVPIGTCRKAPEKSPETLLYQTELMDKAHRIRGLVRAQMYVSADVLDADVILRLIDCTPDGNAFVICDGATRCRYRNRWTPEPLKKDIVYEVDVLMGHTLYTVQPGHRLVLQIAGSAFPKYDVNNGTANKPAYDTQAVKASIYVHHTVEHASKILLPFCDD